MPLATTGEVPPLALVHFELRLGLPEPSTVISRPEMPLSLATKTQTLPSTGFTQTAGCVSTSPVVANGMVFYVGGGGIKALDPTSGTQLFSDSSPGGIHWESPIVIEGRLYVTDESANLWAYEPNAAPLSYYTITPCRVVDTRRPAGPYGGPALAGGARRLFQLDGQCGVPADAKAVAANITAVGAAANGFFSVGPSGVANVTSTVNFSAGQVQAGNAVIGLTGDPLGAAWVLNGSTGTTDLLIDLAGYFK